MFTKTELVKFDNDKYGIRRAWCGLFAEFKDLQHSGFWWSSRSAHFKDCQGTAERAKEVFYIVNPKVVGVFVENKESE